MLIIHRPQEKIISQALSAYDGLVWSVSAEAAILHHNVSSQFLTAGIRMMRDHQKNKSWHQHCLRWVFLALDTAKFYTQGL